MPAYFITFRTYGTWLHGDPRGSVDPRHNLVNTPLIPADQRLYRRDAERCGEPVVLDALRRGVTYATIEHVFAYKGWKIHQLDVRTNHVHLVVSGHESPEQIMIAAKGWATRLMVASGVLPAAVKPWARHGSTPWLNTEGEFNGAVKYVRDEQGPPLERTLPPGFDIERLIVAIARPTEKKRSKASGAADVQDAP